MCFFAALKIITVGLKYHSRFKQKLFRVNILEEKTISYDLFDIYTHFEITPNYKYRSEKAHKFLIEFP